MIIYQMSYFIYAWIASIVFGLEAIIGKITSKYSICNPWLFNFLWTFFILLFMFPVALENNVSIPMRWDYIILAAFFYAVAGILYLFSLYHLDVSAVAPLFNLRTAFSVLLGVIFLGERLLGRQYIFLFLIFISSLFVTLSKKNSFKSLFQLSTGYVVMGMLCLACMSLCINQALVYDGYWEVTLYVSLISQIMLLATVPLFLNDFRKLHLKQVGPVLLMSLCGVIATLATNRAYQTNIGISSTIISLPISMVMVFIISFFYPKLLEKNTMKVYAIRFVSAAIMIFSALELSG